MIGNQPVPNSYAVKSDFRLWNNQKAWRWRWHSATLLSKVERLRLVDLVMVACSMPFQKWGFGSQEMARCNADLMSQLGIICGCWVNDGGGSPWRSAPVLGRSIVGTRASPNGIGRIGTTGARCARGRAHSDNVVVRRH